MMTEVPSPFEAVLEMPITPLLADEAQEAARATLAIAERLTATPKDELAAIDNRVLVQAIKLLAKVEAARQADPGTVTSMKVIVALANPKSEEELQGALESTESIPQSLKTQRQSFHDEGDPPLS